MIDLSFELGIGASYTEACRVHLRNHIVSILLSEASRIGLYYDVKIGEKVFGLRQTGRGCGSNPQTLAPVVTAFNIDYSRGSRTSEQTYVCANKEGNMKYQETMTRETGEHIGIKASLNIVLAFISVAALLVSGFGAGKSPSALAYSYSIKENSRHYLISLFSQIQLFYHSIAGYNL